MIKASVTERIMHSVGGELGGVRGAALRDSDLGLVNLTCSQWKCGVKQAGVWMWNPGEGRGVPVHFSNTHSGLELSYGPSGRRNVLQLTPVGIRNRVTCSNNRLPGAAMGKGRVRGRSPESSVGTQMWKIGGLTAKQSAHAPGVTRHGD